ncbi:MAG: ABC transporter permease [Bacteroidales bacterium]
MIGTISWKNVWRNKTRSLVVIISVTLGIISGVFLVGIMQGWVEQRMHDAIYNEVSHIQIHNVRYLENEEIGSTVDRNDLISSVIRSIPGIKSWSERTKLTAIVTTPWASTGLFLYGVDFAREKELTEIYKKIVQGSGEYPAGGNNNFILISDKTAEILKLKHYIITGELIEQFRKNNFPEKILTKLDSIRDVRFRSPKEFKNALQNILDKKDLDKFGKMITDSALDYRIRSRIQVTFSDQQGTPVQSTFKVSGIFKTTNTGFDQSVAFVDINELASLYGSSYPLIHEVALMLDEIDKVPAISERLASVSGRNSVSTWEDLAPDVAMMNDFMILYYFIFIGIIMLALAFGIINTMLMAILERTKELGMLMAIGMNRKRIFNMIMLETLFLTFVGAITGLVTGWGLISLLGRSGIHFSGWGEGFEAVGFAAVVYPKVTFDFYVFVILMVFFTAVCSSIWPARKALKLNPVETLRTE